MKLCTCNKGPRKNPQIVVISNLSRGLLLGNQNNGKTKQKVVTILKCQIFTDLLKYVANFAAKVMVSSLQRYLN